MSFEDEYRELMAKPIEEIKGDIFFRMDNFQHEPWYGEFQLYLVIGVCQPSEEHVLQIRKGLKVMGYSYTSYFPTGYRPHGAAGHRPA